MLELNIGENGAPENSSIQTTLDTYSHVAPGLQQAAANKFDDIVLPKQKAIAKAD